MPDVVRPRPAVSRVTALLLALTLLAAACTDDAGPPVETATATDGEVVQTVAAAATLEPAAQVQVTAPLGGEIAELFVADGDTVEAGDPLARLDSDTLEQQIAQAEAAVDAAGALGGLGGTGGLDLSALAGGLPTSGIDLAPVFGALAGQFEATVGPLLAVLEDQAAAIEDDQQRAAAQARVAEARDAYQDAIAQLRDAERDAQRQAAEARAAQRSAQASAQEAQRAADAAQREAVAAQRRQAELALEALEQRGDDLLVVAPVAGTVELARGGGAGGGLGDLGALGGLEGLAGQLGGLGDLPGALDGPGDPGGGAGPEGGAVAEGVAVTAGQPLLTLYDLSAFRARVDIDEIDVVEVAVGQGVTVLVDAFPDAQLRGRVETVAIAPTRGPAGGAVFPVVVALTAVPDDVALRVGLSASAEIETRRLDGEVVVPTSALLRLGGQEVVFVVEEGRVREVPVEVLAIGDETAALDGDLAVGDEVVTIGVETVADGDTL